uniref:Uncharacterized protein n=1 Tax=Anopheles farauti TaxID=69004 RepID=A0A182QSV0_9DIPT
MTTEKGWENTLRIDMSQLPERPKEIIALLGQIVLPSDGSVRAHLNAVLFHVYIQMNTMEQVKNFVKRNRGKHGITIGGVRHLYDIELVDGAVDVKVLDLPYFVSDYMLRSALSVHGRVLEINEQRYPETVGALVGALTGVRVHSEDK